MERYERYCIICDEPLTDYNQTYAAGYDGYCDSCIDKVREKAETLFNRCFSHRELMLIDELLRERELL